MITICKNETIQIKQKEDLILVEIRGLSTDTKPIVYNEKKIDNGSIFIEIDTGNIFFYDLENQEWKEV